MNEKRDPLDDIIVDEDQSMDRTLLAEMLKQEVKITKQGEICFDGKYHAYKQWEKIILYLLARKVRAIKKISNSKEGASLKEIEEGTMIPSKSVSRAFNHNLKGILKKDKSFYSIPNYNLSRCKLILEGKEKIPNLRKNKTSQGDT